MPSPETPYDGKYKHARVVDFTALPDNHSSADLYMQRENSMTSSPEILKDLLESVDAYFQRNLKMALEGKHWLTGDEVQEAVDAFNVVKAELLDLQRKKAELATASRDLLTAMGEGGAPWASHRYG